MRRIVLFVALIIGLIPNNVFAQAEKHNAIITMKYQKTDSAHLIHFNITDLNQLPLRDITVSVYVKRMFGMMKLSDVFTDSTGKASLSISNKLPGSDSLSNIFVLAKIEDNKELKDTSFQIKFKSTIAYQWSQPLERSTFSSHAPIWLIITFSILFGGVWLVYLKVISMIRKIKKAGNSIP